MDTRDNREPPFTPRIYADVPCAECGVYYPAKGCLVAGGADTTDGDGVRPLMWAHEGEALCAGCRGVGDCDGTHCDSEKATRRYFVGVSGQDIPDGVFCEPCWEYELAGRTPLNVEK